MDVTRRFRRYVTSEQRVKRRKSRFLRAAVSMTPYVVADKATGLFLVPPLGGEKLFADSSRGEFVTLERAVHVLRASELLTGGGTIVDVGANIGTTTVSALSVHGFDRAVAIEPDPENCLLLRTNVALNDLYGRVAVVSAAASSRAGRAKFDRIRDVRRPHQIGSGRLTDESAPNLIDVETVSLDHLIERQVIDPEQARLLWLDVQGHEDEVLLAAMGLVRRRVPIVLALRPHLLRRPAAMVELLREHYDVLIDLRHPTLKPGWEPRVEPIAGLEGRLGKRLSTDVLVHAGARTVTS
jgi:FkbM family methyltransferase